MSATAPRVLIVESSIPVARITVDLLRQRGFSPSHCGSTAAAVRAVRTTPPDAAVIALDLGHRPGKLWIPGFGLAGLDAIAALRTKRPGLPVVLLTTGEAIDLEELPTGPLERFDGGEGIDEIADALRRMLAVRSTSGGPS